MSAADTGRNVEAHPQAEGAEPGRVIALRGLAIALSLVAGCAAGVMFLQYAAATRLSHWAWVAAVLLSFSTAWLAWGAMLGLIGLAPSRVRVPEAATISGRTVVVMPICNEDALITFARIAAMHRQLAGCPAQVDFAILSDTRSAEGAAREEAALALLLAETGADAPEGGGGRIHYRRRSENIGRKAGNLAEFIRRSGAAWDYAVILDADSLIEAETILRMIRRIEAEPRLGLLQTLPCIVGARSVFGRAMQFAASFHGPVFTRGLMRLQGETGPYWGHNAILRIPAFAQCCGLPELPGRPPLGGHILSHDYVEAALLARGGWIVRVDADLGGSYEEAPENLVDHAKRDRRWCQGNLQHSKILPARGLRFWSRAALFQGIVSYLSSAFWALFLLTAVLAGLWQSAPDYFPGVVAIWHDRVGFLPVFPRDESLRALSLLVGIFGLLLLPKLLVMAEAFLTGRSRAFGGAGALVSLLAELALSALIAPVLMAYQCRSILQILSGRDGGWPANNRGDGQLGLAEAWAASRFITLWALAALVLARAYVPDQLPWLLPVLVPMVLAPVLISLTSRPIPGEGCFLTPQEMEPPAIVALHAGIVAGWSGPQAQSRTGAATGAQAIAKTGALTQ
ncbi:glucans biosynthesis glucosyltransferase MdoH [Pseudogemmobacter sonorensis]|uniref:glucans biosynthesis glucosyltransferase MdoH n=1 Tax=Pseudogemmobacter sonorensis TaxID=2989681 RepID=UPI00367B8E5F